MLCITLGLSTARADPSVQHLTVGGGFDGSIAPAHDGADAGGHGWFLLRQDREGMLPRGARLSIELNTDTLRVTIDRARFDRVELGFGLLGEALLAGVLIDYVRDGRNDGARGFFASYVGAVGGAKIDLRPHYLELTALARRWFFNPSPSTDPLLILPPDAWVGEVRLKYTYWALKPDRSQWEPQRMHWRVHGLAGGVELGFDQRSEARPWGARDPAFSPRDSRNDPSLTIVAVHQWLRVGAQMNDRLRLQARQEAHWMWGEDDLVRMRIGGMNPYVVPLAGATWPAYLAGKVFAVEASLHLRVKDEHELGLLVDCVLADDIHRVGDDHLLPLAGIGAFADLRWGRWQLDVRAGWSPTVQPDRVLGGFSAMVYAGWGR